MKSSLTTTINLVLGLAIGVALSACAPIVAVMPAVSAASKDCAAVSVRLPGILGSGTSAVQERRETDAQGTAAWGNPTAILLRCGVPPLPPTTNKCVTINGVDWIVQAVGSNNYKFTTFGRNPAVEVLVDSNRVSGTTIISDLSPAVSVIPTNQICE